MNAGRRTTSAVVGVTLLLVAVGALAVRYVPIEAHAVLYLVIASPYLMLAAPVALALLALRRHRKLAGFAAALTVALVGVQLPWYVAEDPNPASAEVRAMTVNMLYGRADAAAMARLAQDGADILMAQELTPKAAQRLSSVGIDKAFPYQILDARPGSAGVGIYSRYPMTSSARIGGYKLALVSARVHIPQVSQDVSVLSVHLDAPWPRPIDGWQSDIAKFPSTLADVATKAADGAILVGGDFNSTIDMLPFRQLLTHGYEDAAWQAGSGRNFTYPANKRYPPVLGIDHLLTRNATAVSTSTVELPGTDHRALLTTVMVPTD